MIRVATSLLSPEEMGKVSLVMTTIAFFALFLVNPVGMFINRRLHSWKESGSAKAYLEHYVVYLIGVALLSGVSLFFFNLLGVIRFGMPIAWVIGLVCLSLTANTINQTSIPALNMLGEMRQYVLLSVATLAASFICAVSLMHAGLVSAQYWVLGQLIGQMLLGVVATQKFLVLLESQHGKSTKPIVGTHQFAAVLNFAWPVALAAGLGWMQFQVYRFLIEENLGLSQLGLFVAGYGISAGLIAGFESILTAYFQPRLYRDASSGHTAEYAQRWRQYAISIIPSLLLTVALIIMLAPELTRVFLGERFQMSTEFLVWGALAEAARVLIGIYSLIAHVFMRTRWLLMPSVFGAFLSIMSSMLLIPQLGLQGAGIALVLSGFSVVALLHMVLAFKIGASLKIRDLLPAFLAMAVLCLVVIGAKALINSHSLIMSTTALATSGIVYIALLYGLLRSCLVDTRKK
jgi:O-antigen/teichoic acid export membrane protein